MTYTEIIPATAADITQIAKTDHLHRIEKISTAINQGECYIAKVIISQQILSRVRWPIQGFTMMTSGMNFQNVKYEDIRSVR